MRSRGAHLCYFLNGAVALIDGDIGVGVAVCVGVRDGDSAERLATDDARTLGRGTIEWLDEAVVLVCVAMRPAIDCDGLDVSRGIEAARGEHAAELIVNVLFEGVEPSGE